MWVRGLKQIVFEACQKKHTSHPMWVRGLKQNNQRKNVAKEHVAPYVGAWIETVLVLEVLALRLSHPMWVRGLKLLCPLGVAQGASRTLCGCVD